MSEYRPFNPGIRPRVISDGQRKEEGGREKEEERRTKDEKSSIPNRQLLIMGLLL